MTSCALAPPFFFFNDTATTEIYTLSLHDALPISSGRGRRSSRRWPPASRCRLCSPCPRGRRRGATDRKSTRLNSSHGYISYAVFCLKKKNGFFGHNRFESGGRAQEPHAVALVTSV